MQKLISPLPNNWQGNVKLRSGKEYLARPGITSEKKYYLTNRGKKMDIEKILYLLTQAKERARQDLENAKKNDMPILYFYRGRMEAYDMAIQIIKENQESE